MFSAASVIAITHRLLPHLHLFSRVLAFERGACVEDGSPAELLEQSDSQLRFLFEQVERERARGKGGGAFNIE